VSVVDLHPENLLDKEIRGELDGAERQRLEIHLAQCATCRLERQLRADFALDLSRGSIPPEIASLVESLARRGTEDAPVPVALPRRGRRMKVVLLTVAATLTLVAGAFASTEAGRRAVAPFFGRQAEVAPPFGEARHAAAAPILRAPAAPPASAPLLPAPPPSLAVAPPVRPESASRTSRSPPERRRWTVPRPSSAPRPMRVGGVTPRACWSCMPSSSPATRKATKRRSLA
jgi:hypothetical protein